LSLIAGVVPFSPLIADLSLLMSAIAFWIPLSLTLMSILIDLSEFAVANSFFSAALILLICAVDSSLT